jgi:hypothetical protein
VSFLQFKPDEVTGGTTHASCHSATCGDWVAIECSR